MSGPGWLTQAEEVEAGIHVRPAESTIKQDFGVPCRMQDGLKLELWGQLGHWAACTRALHHHAALVLERLLGTCQDTLYQAQPVSAHKLGSESVTFKGLPVGFVELHLCKVADFGTSHAVMLSMNADSMQTHVMEVMFT